jgi:hypothetical protein
VLFQERRESIHQFFLSDRQASMPAISCGQAPDSKGIPTDNGHQGGGLSREGKPAPLAIHYGGCIGWGTRKDNNGRNYAWLSLFGFILRVSCCNTNCKGAIEQKTTRRYFLTDRLGVGDVKGNILP